jgi:hypothetical protein
VPWNKLSSKCNWCIHLILLLSMSTVYWAINLQKNKNVSGSYTFRYTCHLSLINMASSCTSSLKLGLGTVAPSRPILEPIMTPQGRRFSGQWCGFCMRLTSSIRDTTYLGTDSTTHLNWWKDWGTRASCTVAQSINLRKVRKPIKQAKHVETILILNLTN